MKRIYLSHYRDRGFTLIELLLAIAIIAILSSIILSAFNDPRAKSRNSKRISDVEQLVVALNLYYNDHNSSWPDNGSEWACISATCYGEWSFATANTDVDAALSSYIEKPADPPDGVRLLGGYLYSKYFGGDVSHYDGQPIEEGGPYLNYDVEGPPTVKSCGQGKIFSVSENENVVQCLWKIN